MTQPYQAMKSILAVMSITALTACTSTFNGPEQAMTVDERYPIEVSETTATLQVDSLSASNKAMINAFVAEYKQRGHGPMVISGASGNLARSVERAVKAEGVSMVQRSPGGGSVATLSFARYVASVKECGDWSDNLATSYNNTAWDNFGCATQNNLAAMIEDPKDLVEPRGTTGLDQDRRSTILENYRAGRPTASTRTDEESAAISEAIE